MLVETERLILRRYLASDAPALAASGDHVSIGANLRDRFPSPYTLADAEAFIQLRSTSADSVYPRHVGVFVKANRPENPSEAQLHIGSMGTAALEDVEYRTWELGYWFTPSAWGKGFATEAVRGFVLWAFDAWPELYRIQATPYHTNVASQRVLQKSGFVQEGRKRKCAEKAGVLLDLYVYGVLRSDVGME